MISRERQIEIEIEVKEMLKEYELATYPISISKVAKALGIDLIPYSSLAEKERNLAFTASEDAFSICSPDLTIATIVFNDTNGSNFNRARFSEGHEIGHIHLNHKENTPNREEEADYYSGYLLAPHPLIHTGSTIASVASRFGISQQCASFACSQTKARHKEGGPWRPYEKWLIDHATWEGGGLLGRA